MKPSTNSIAALGACMFGFLSALSAQDRGRGQVAGETRIEAPVALPVDQGLVTSRSGQFSVSGSDAVMRAAAANFAEETKAEILKLLGEKDAWKVRVRVELSGTPGGPATLRSTVLNLTYNELGYQVAIMVNLNRGLQQEDYQRALISSWVLTRALEDGTKGAQEVRFSVPPWLVEGLSETIAWRTGKSDRRLYETLFRHGGLFEVDKILAVDDAGFLDMDAASKAAFRVSSGALVMALHEQPEGNNGFRSLLKEIAMYDGEMPSLLRQHFSGLNLSRHSLEKWWVLQLAEKGVAPLTEVLRVFETDETLQRILLIRYRDKERMLHEIPLEDWNKIPALDLAERTDAIRMTGEDLVRLSYRCFPSYRPLLSEYQILLSRWAAGKHENMDKDLLELAQMRKRMTEKSERAGDYLDWFEITQARETSGVFDDYLSLKSRLKNQNQRRTDGLSAYLDRLDPLFAVPVQERFQSSFMKDLPQD